MKDIPIGARAELTYTVTRETTVPHIYPEFEEFRQMPEVFATGLMVSMLEACCQRAILPYLDWPREGSLGTHVNFSHLAPTAPGMTIHVQAEVIAVDGRRITFRAEAHDGIDKISEGTHERAVVDYARFNAKVADKRARAGLAG
ncbi:thioesterase family protein [Caldimonas thermodepolymerans]|jgi:fluoroacetyl-CoA thioesterase|uniref:Thioesterase n=1 Tax=Caldimonas thermodepolymerans TaxID=215580 RepID=A0A2S5T2B2_9BURK|nr:thioesterase family protein [Caldimonas thermodepolymerans]PPE69059.1 thioesterase [Caldimonas thermodepolymerans]QPC32118.1 thioesterase family protein [Caldimonas thermodepolymerans]RDH95865.1 thioesterase superfamily protein [Caldimonas thermodepolymerans]TCP08228.1 thioesterase superfamily protein [Caldimonas thermodepolymerans]UZG44915.1 thioesterase family protein [Caldimonas thermodepolymerans]